ATSDHRAHTQASLKEAQPDLVVSERRRRANGPLVSTTVAAVAQRLLLELPAQSPSELPLLRRRRARPQLRRMGPRAGHDGAAQRLAATRAWLSVVRTRCRPLAPAVRLLLRATCRLVSRLATKRVLRRQVKSSLERTNSANGDPLRIRGDGFDRLRWDPFILGCRGSLSADLCA